MKNNKKKPQQYRSSHSQMSFKIGTCKNLTNQTGELQVIRTGTKLKRDPKTGTPPGNLRNLQERLFFHRAPLVAVSDSNSNNNKKYTTI